MPSAAAQPDRILGTVGDVDFPAHGGGEVYMTEHGPMLEYVVPPDGDFGAPVARWHIYQVELTKGVPEGSLKAVAKFADWRPSDLKAAFESNDPMERARAYVDWAAYYNWELFDGAPLVLDKQTVEERYETEIEPYDDDEPEGEGEGEGEGDDEDPFSDEEMHEGYVIQDSRRGGYDVAQSNKLVGHYADTDEAIKAIIKRMEKEKFFPNIYYVNDHGNVDLLDKDGKIIESRV